MRVALRAVQLLLLASVVVCAVAATTRSPLLVQHTAHAAASSSDSVQWWRSVQATNERLVQQPTAAFAHRMPSTKNVVNVTAMNTAQTWMGFGTAITQAASYVFSQLSAELQQVVLDMYFADCSYSHCYRFIRLPIGACDFSLFHFSYVDTPGNLNLSTFSIDVDRMYVLPVLHRADEQVRAQYAPEGLKILASPWSAPAWMKINNSPYCKDQNCANGCELQADPLVRTAYAHYFSRYLTAYAKEEDLPIWGITIQNEPEYCPVSYEGMHFTPETQRDFLRDYLGPVLSVEHPETRILIYDHNKDHVAKWASVILGDPATAKYVYGTAFHWYTGDQFENVAQVRDMFPDKVLIASEATEALDDNPRQPAWGKGEHYAHDIIGDMNAGASAWIDWNFMLDLLGGPNHLGPDLCENAGRLCGSDSMLMVDVHTQTLYPQVFYYYMGHLSRFLQAGARVVPMPPAQCAAGLLECAAVLQPDGVSVAAVVLNTGDADVAFELFDAVTVRTLALTAPAHSIATFTWSNK